MNYAEARDVLSGKLGYGYARKLAKLNPKREGVKLANNTWLEKLPHWHPISPLAIGLRLHLTYVLIFTPHFVEMTTGGYPTMTTADRLRIGPGYVASHKAVGGWAWYPQNQESGYPDWSNPNVYPFYDGLRVRNDGYGILRTQPNRPNRFRPIVTRSGFTGGAVGFAAARQTYSGR